MKKMYRYLILAFLPIFSVGCAQIGPSSIRAARNDYNIAIQQTGNEQQLLNIVRLKYRDTPAFLQLTSVTTNYTVQSSASVSATIKSGDKTPYGISGSLLYADRPTVTYTPLQGDKFVAQVMSPIDLSTLALLYHSGWSIDRILRLTVQNMNKLKNAPTASGPTPEKKPQYERFREATQLLKKLQADDHLQLGLVVEEKDRALQLRIAKSAKDLPEVRQLTTLLGLRSGLTTYKITAGIETADDQTIGVTTRSFIGILFYVSQAVEVPKHDEKAGRITVTYDEHGSNFDWKSMTGDLLRIRASDIQPENAYVRINYRGSWFYIDDSDLTSKSTFALLQQLFALAAGDIKSTAPVLTLSVGQ